jgi:hypothetical protein
LPEYDETALATRLQQFSQSFLTKLRSKLTSILPICNIFQVSAEQPLADLVKHVLGVFSNISTVISPSTLPASPHSGMFNLKKLRVSTDLQL